MNIKNERPRAVAHVRGRYLRPHHRRLLRLCLVDCLLVRLWHRLRVRFLGLRLLLRSLWLNVSRRGWPGRPPRRRGQRGSSVAVSGFVREPLPLVAGSGWHLRQPPRRGWRAWLVPILAPRAGLLGRVSGGEWNFPRALHRSLPQTSLLLLRLSQTGMQVIQPVKRFHLWNL